MTDELNRAAPAAAQLDADLPPPDLLVKMIPIHSGGPFAGMAIVPTYSSQLVGQAVAQYAERIRLLEHKLWCAEVNLDGAKEHIAELERAQQPAQSIGDDSKFHELAGEVYNAGSHNESIEKSLNALIAYIDGRTAAGPKGEKA